MKLEELKELLDLLLEKGITEFEHEENGVRLKIKKGLDPVAPAPVTQPAQIVNSNPARRPSEATAEASPSATSTVEEVGVTLVRSPMVGTFYRAPDPNAPLFVNEGDRVEVGQVLCIIEAMKLMNEIESEEVGEIVRIFVENGQPVQYGDELFAVRVST